MTDKGYAWRDCSPIPDANLALKINQAVRTDVNIVTNNQVSESPFQIDKTALIDPHVGADLRAQPTQACSSESRVNTQPKNLLY